MKLERRGTPLELLLEISQAINEKFAYVPNSTLVDSPIDDALAERKGVCQDFAHIMIALARKLRIPCRVQRRRRTRTQRLRLCRPLRRPLERRHGPRHDRAARPPAVDGREVPGP